MRFTVCDIDTLFNSLRFDWRLNFKNKNKNMIKRELIIGERSPNQKLIEYINKESGL